MLGLVVALLTVIPPLAAGAVAGAPEAPGAPGAARVVEDPYGIVHVYASTPADAFEAIGYLQARDRLFQMDTSRRRAEGTLAELLGPRALPEDVHMRTLGLGRAAASSLQTLPPQVRAELEAFSRGVNRYIQQSQTSGTLPPEYARLELTQVRPWTPQDSLSVLKLLAFQGSFHLEVPLASVLQAYTRALGPDAAWRAVFRDLWGPVAAHVGPASSAVAVSPKRSREGFALLANDLYGPLTQPAAWYLQHVAVEGPEGALEVAGAAAPGVPWVIAGFTREVAWGLAATAADVTDTYVEQVVEQEGRLFTRFRGDLEPVRVLPQRFRVNVVGDGQPDHLREATADEGAPGAVMEVPRHGPLVRLSRELGQALSVRWIGFSATRDALAFYLWNRARSLEDFQAGIQALEGWAQGWTYGDREGHIAYFASGQVPLREDLEAGYPDGGPAWVPSLLRDGSGLYRHEWAATLPPSPVPRALDPAEELIVGAPFDPGLRAPRVQELARQPPAGGLTAADLMAIQADRVGLAAARLAPFLLRAWQNARAAPPGSPLAELASDPELAAAMGYLEGWDFSTPTGVRGGFDAGDEVVLVRPPAPVPGVEPPAPPGGMAPAPIPMPGGPTPAEIRHSVAASLFHLWLGQLIRTTVDAAVARLGSDLPRPDGLLATMALIRHLEGFDAAGQASTLTVRLFDLQGVELPPEVERDLLLLSALREALRLARSAEFEAVLGGQGPSGLRWGRLHRLVLAHPADRDLDVPPQAGFEGELYRAGIPVDGSFDTVDAAPFDPRVDHPEGFRVRFGPALRLVVEMRPEGPQGFVALAGGQSGVPGAPHFGDLLPLWLANRYVPLPLGPQAAPAP